MPSCPCPGFFRNGDGAGTTARLVNDDLATIEANRSKYKYKVILAGLVVIAAAACLITYLARQHSTPGASPEPNYPTPEPTSTDAPTTAAPLAVLGQVICDFIEYANNTVTMAWNNTESCAEVMQHDGTDLAKNDTLGVSLAFLSNFIFNCSMPVSACVGYYYNLAAEACRAIQNDPTACAGQGVSNLILSGSPVWTRDHTTYQANFSVTAACSTP